MLTSRQRINKSIPNMTTQTLAHTITLRHEMPLDELLRLLPDFRGAMDRQLGMAESGAQVDQAFWTTFAFGSTQAAVLFGLIYAYFAF